VFLEILNLLKVFYELPTLIFMFLLSFFLLLFAGGFFYCKRVCVIFMSNTFMYVCIYV